MLSDILCIVPSRSQLEEFGPQYEKGPLTAYAGNEGLDQTLFTQSDHGIHYPLRESLDIIEYINR